MICWKMCWILLHLIEWTLITIDGLQKWRRFLFICIIRYYTFILLLLSCWPNLTWMICDIEILSLYNLISICITFFLLILLMHPGFNILICSILFHAILIYLNTRFIFQATIMWNISPLLICTILLDILKILSITFIIFIKSIDSCLWSAVFLCYDSWL